MFRFIKLSYLLGRSRKSSLNIFTIFIIWVFLIYGESPRQLLIYLGLSINQPIQDTTVKELFPIWFGAALRKV